MVLLCDVPFESFFWAKKVFNRYYWFFIGLSRHVADVHYLKISLNPSVIVDFCQGGEKEKTYKSKAKTTFFIQYKSFGKFSSFFATGLLIEYLGSYRCCVCAYNRKCLCFVCGH